MVAIVSRSEFPPEDDDADVDVHARSTHHQLRMGSGSKITESPASNSRPRGASPAPTEAPAPYSRPEYIGKTIDGRYFVEKPLGEGGMGVVYQCRHTIIDKRVAMKVLRADLARNEEVTERFLNEARSASSIGNPHIIDISDFGRLPDGATYFVMEFLTGTSLADIVDSHEVMEPARLGHIALQLCEGLAAAHSAGIVHRDLKPDNIFLVTQGSRADFVKILDFGIAKASRIATKLTQAGQVFGTAHYMSPEQASGAEVDLRSDIYSVGVILYELATGQLPFDADNFMAILTQHMYKTPPAPSSIDGLAPLLPGLEELILKCLAKAPSERYQTMPELMGDLREVFSDVLPIASPDARIGTDAYSTPQQLARPSSNRARKSPVPSAPNRQPSDVEQQKRHIRLYAGIGLSAALSAGALVWFFASNAATVSNPAAPLPASSQLAAAPTQLREAAKSTLGDAEQASAPRKTAVALAVVPLTAHVFAGDRDLGESPVMVEVGDEPLVLEARADGHRSKSIVVDGKQTKISVALEPLKAKKVKAAPPAAQSSPSAKPKRASSSDGVVNPWD